MFFAKFPVARMADSTETATAVAVVSDDLSKLNVTPDPEPVEV